MAQEAVTPFLVTTGKITYCPRGGCIQLESSSGIFCAKNRRGSSSCEYILLGSWVHQWVFWRSISNMQHAQYRQVFGHSTVVFILQDIFRKRKMCVDCFTLKARSSSFAKINSVFQSLPGSLKHKGWLRAMTHGQETASQGTPYLLPYLGCGNKRWGGAGACWWKSRGKVKCDSFHFLGKGLENSHPFLYPSLLANGVVLVVSTVAPLTAVQ